MSRDWVRSLEYLLTHVHKFDNSVTFNSGSAPQQRGLSRCYMYVGPFSTSVETTVVPGSHDICFTYCTNRTLCWVLVGYTCLSKVYLCQFKFYPFQANEQQRRFEDLLKICRQVNPQLDISYFMNALNPECAKMELNFHKFRPADITVVSSEVCSQSTTPNVK